jgi:ferredoxin-fold anticodon binding domain-containing protein
MTAKEAKKLIGQKVTIQRRYSGIVDHGTILSVTGRNVLVDFMGMTDWLWLPDCIIRPTPEATND